MTLQELIVAALEELNRPTDTAETAARKAQFTRFANEALIDITSCYRLWRRDEVSVAEDRVDCSGLPQTMVKALALKRDGVRIPFYYGADANTLHTKGIADGAAELTYRYMPAPLEELTDVPDIPEFLHPLIVTFIVARERIQLDSVAQSGSKTNLNLYETMKRRLRVLMDAPEDQSIIRGG